MLVEPSLVTVEHPRPETITNNDAEYALEIVKTICSEIGLGLPGSSQERQRATVIKKELESHLGPGNVAVEEFTLAPGAMLGSLPVSALILLVAAVLNIYTASLTGTLRVLTATTALALSIVPILVFVVEFILGHELIDPLFTKNKSINVIGTLRRPGTTTVTRLLILSGHHDSALEFTWARLPGIGLLIALGTILIGLVAVPTMSTIQLAGIIFGDTGITRIGTLGWVTLVYPTVPAIIFALFFNRGRKNGGTVPGAADNLSGSALTAAMSKILAENPSNIPPDTEVRFISFGSEEAGLRGSRRYAQRHLDELKRLDGQLLNFETVVHPEIDILTSDSAGVVKNSTEMVKSVADAAERAGVPYKVRPAFLGVATDAASFSRAGLKAATLLPFKFPEQMLAFYHQNRDRPEVLTMEPFLNTLKVSFEWIRSGGA